PASRFPATSGSRTSTSRSSSKLSRSISPRLLASGSQGRGPAGGGGGGGQGPATTRHACAAPLVWAPSGRDTSVAAWRERVAVAPTPPRRPHPPARRQCPGQAWVFVRNVERMVGLASAGEVLHRGRSLPPGPRPRRLRPGRG